ncbi:RNA polymerase sigma-70 factor [Persicitalea jodogahamensis]|uniref:DNA-directed RNA polymerase sigma-70 factor n=1 Tax=Persicitalea jodogahamensis TaxID=402147 RepID=A0A8J3D826_9BACT|nr:RNA polymerase sigma-70 factor [Persicitalea jodogahamensis]GHB63793.1 DNA-directed RNA polymerase sigma-70 factor [Persicitalea jodogahamensis]
MISTKICTLPKHWALSQSAMIRVLMGVSEISSSMNSSNYIPANDLTFKSVFDSSYSGLVYFSSKIIGDKAEAEDIVQNAFVSYWRCKENVGSEVPAIKSFLYTTVKNSCMDLLKHRLVIRKFRDQLEKEPMEENLMENQIIYAEVLSELFGAIEKLPAGSRQVLEMSYLQGKKNYEISEELGLSINTVKTQKQRAISLLRLKLAPSSFLHMLVLFCI